MSKGKFLLLLFIILVTCVPCSFASSYDEEPDSCFFRITTKESRKIYVLGSAHSIKVKDSFSEPVIEELTKIATIEKPYLYTEHKINNADALTLINDANVILNWSSQVLSSNHDSLLDDTIYIEAGNPSTTTIKDLFKLEPWLAASILSTHTGILFYPNFGGTEHELEHNEPWKNCWSNIGYLEGPEHYELLKSAAKLEHEHNKKWIQSSLSKLLLIKSILRNPNDGVDEQSQQKLQKEKETSLQDMKVLLSNSKSSFRSQGWEVVNYNGIGIPSSVFLRNQLWVDNLMKALSQSSINKDNTPVLIVVGNGHLAAIEVEKSFLFLLSKALNTQNIDRFINITKKWRSVFE